MNRLASLQLYPVKYRKFFYLATPTVFIFFTLAILISFFGISFEKVKDYWYLPALFGGVFTWYVSQNVLLNEGDPDLKKDIDADATVLKGELERANRFIKPLIQGLGGVFAATILLRPPFYREIGQVTDLAVMIGFFALGAYFRQVLHVYARTPGASQEEIGGRYGERGLFQILGWGALFFFFLKTVTLKGKMGNSWSGLPDVQQPDSILIIALIVYLFGIFGVLSQTYFEKDQNDLGCLFDAFMAFGTAFPLVWLYPHLHPYLFIDLPSWIIQLPLLFLLIVNSAGIFFSFQARLPRKILGNTCLWFVRHGEQILAFIVLWTVVTTYAGMSPVAALILYGVVFVLLALISRRSETSILAILAAIIAISPLLIKMYTGELTAKVEARVALVKEIQQKKEAKKL